MEEGKIKNTITRSFELQDYTIEGTELSGFSVDSRSKEELVVEVNYSPENKKTFSPEETGKLLPGKSAINATALRLSFPQIQNAKSLSKI